MLEVVYVLAFFSFQTTMVELNRYDDLKECRAVATQLQELAKKEWTIGRYHCVIFPK